MLAAALVASAAAAYPTVHVSPSASDVERFAAVELRNYLGNLSTRAGMPPVRLHVADEKPAGDVIAVGFDAATGLGLAASELEGLKNDSYVISSKKSGIPSGSFVVTGGKASARGCMFAVYDFLRLLGCKFLARGAGTAPPGAAFTMQEELPSSPPAAIPPVDVTYHPLYEYRDNNEWWVTRTGDRWAGKLGYNGPNAHGAAPGTMAVACKCSRSLSPFASSFAQPQPAAAQTPAGSCTRRTAC